MLDFLVKMVGALPAERKPVLLLLGKGFFMGIFLASYQIGVEVIFLKTPGLGAEHLATAIFAAGICALISAFVFVYLQKRIAFSKLVAGNLILFTVFLIAISFLYEITSKQGAESAYYKEVVFVSFMMMGPIMAIILLGFLGNLQPYIRLEGLQNGSSGGY